LEVTALPTVPQPLFKLTKPYLILRLNFQWCNYFLILYLIRFVIACSRIDADWHDQLTVQDGQAFAGCRGQRVNCRVVAGPSQVAGHVKLADGRIPDEDLDPSIRLQT